jgi:hypothetical protein
MIEQFTCALCRETFDFEEKNETAHAEMESHFGTVPDVEVVYLCGACYDRFHPADHPEQVSAVIKELKGDA